MIRHAPEAALRPVDPLPVPVIELSFRAVLVFPVGKPRLPASHPAAAPLSAVDLPPVAASTDVKHHPATRPSAKQLDPCHFAGHTPHDSIAACEPCRVGGDAGGQLVLGGVGKGMDGLCAAVLGSSSVTDARVAGESLRDARGAEEWTVTEARSKALLLEPCNVSWSNRAYE